MWRSRPRHSNHVEARGWKLLDALLADWGCVFFVESSYPLSSKYVGYRLDSHEDEDVLNSM